MTPDEHTLTSTLDDHKLWLADSSQGTRADFAGADRREA